MSLLFHPKTLQFIVKFKKTQKISILKKVLPFLIDNTEHIDLFFLEEVLFSHHPALFSNQVNDKMSDKVNNIENLANDKMSDKIGEMRITLKNLILKLFRKKEINGKSVCYFYSCGKINPVVLQNRTNLPSVFGNKESINFIEFLNKIRIKKEFRLNNNYGTDNSGVDSSIIDNSITVNSIIDTDVNNQAIINTEGGCLPFTNISLNDPNDGLPRNRKCVVKIKNRRLSSENDIILMSAPDPVPTNHFPTNHFPANYSPINHPLASHHNFVSKIKKGQSVLNFSKMSLPVSKPVEKFTPLELKNDIIKNDRNSPKETLRKRDDLVNPVKLQFIKHYDQIRPPIYRRRGRMIRVIESYKKIPEILSYDDDSSNEWEICEDEEETQENETLSSNDSSELDGSWIEEDSENVEVTRYNKKPNFIFDEIPIEEYFDDGRFSMANLKMSDEIQENLKIELREYYSRFNGEREDFISLFSELFNVKTSTILKYI